jgi:hypothetical protein
MCAWHVVVVILCFSYFTFSCAVIVVCFFFCRIFMAELAQLAEIERAIERLTTATVSAVASADATVRDLAEAGPAAAVCERCAVFYYCHLMGGGGLIPKSERFVDELHFFNQFFTKKKKKKKKTHSDGDAAEAARLEAELGRLTAVSLRQAARLEALRARRDASLAALAGGETRGDSAPKTAPGGRVTPLKTGAWAGRQDTARA